MSFASDRIGPTADYTGYVWARNGLSRPELATREGRLLFDSLQPVMLGSQAIGGATLESYLLARHRALPSDAVAAIWRRFATTLGGFAAGRYLSDLHLGGAVTPQVRVFRLALSAFVRGRVYLHFSDAAEAEQALLTAGFADAQVWRAVDVIDRRNGRGSRLANILEASITLPPEASTT